MSFLEASELPQGRTAPTRTRTLRTCNCRARARRARRSSAGPWCGRSALRAAGGAALFIYRKRGVAEAEPGAPVHQSAVHDKSRTVVGGVGSRSRRRPCLEDPPTGGDRKFLTKYFCPEKFQSDFNQKSGLQKNNTGLTDHREHHHSF